MSTDFPTAPLAPGHKGAGGGAVEKSHHASHTKNLTLPRNARCYQKFAVPIHGRPYRDFYYNVTYEAIAFVCGKWGAKKLGISHLSASGHYHQDIATCHAEALAHFCDENPDIAPESFIFCGCCIGVEHLKGIQQLLSLV